MALLSIHNLHRSFGGLHAVNDVSFDVEAGTIKAVIGPNGAGKTTLFNLISGAIRPDSGVVLYHGASIYGFPPYRIAARGISRTYQNIKLFGHMTVLENVMIGRHTQSTAGFLAGMFNLPRTWKEESSIRSRSMEIIDMLGIADLAETAAGSCAFGQQRAIEFARALACEPKLLLLDEPAAGLNIHETREVALLIKRIRDMGITILIIEHDMSLVMDISDEIVVLNYGQKIAEGKPTAIQKNPDVISIYLGDDNAQD